MEEEGFELRDLGLLYEAMLKSYLGELSHETLACYFTYEDDTWIKRNLLDLLYSFFCLVDECSKALIYHDFLYVK